MRALTSLSTALCPSTQPTAHACRQAVSQLAHGFAQREQHLVRAIPVRAEDLESGPGHEPVHRQGEQEEIVQASDHGQEIRNEVEGGEGVDDRSSQERLVGSRDPGVADEPGEKSQISRYARNELSDSHRLARAANPH